VNPRPLQDAENSAEGVYILQTATVSELWNWKSTVFVEKASRVFELNQ